MSITIDFLRFKLKQFVSYSFQSFLKDPRIVTRFILNRSTQTSSMIFYLQYSFPRFDSYEDPIQCCIRLLLETNQVFQSFVNLLLDLNGFFKSDAGEFKGNAISLLQRRIESQSLTLNIPFTSPNPSMNNLEAEKRAAAPKEMDGS